MEKEKLIADVKDYLSDYEMDNIDESKNVELLQAYVGDANKLLHDILQFLEQ